MAEKKDKPVSEDVENMLMAMGITCRMVGGVRLTEDLIQASFDIITTGPSFRLAFDGKNSDIVRKSGRRERGSRFCF
jgi:hypothetical protein